MAISTTAAAPARQNMLGASHLLASIFLFAVMDAMVKWLTASFPVHQVVFFRSAFALVPCLVLAAQAGGLATLRTGRPWGHFLRGLVGVVSMVLIFHAYSVMKLADAAAILFSGPLFLTALAGPVLGERVGLRRWTAVLAGFAGVLVIIQPGSGAIGPGALAALTAAALYAVAMIMVRRLGATEGAVAITFYFSLFGAVAGAAMLAALGWTAPTPAQFVLLALVGIIGGIAQLFMSQAFRLAETGVIGPLKYSSMIWVVLFGYLVWGELPAPHVVLGTAIVIASGLYILHRETRLAILERRRAVPLR